MKLKFLALSLLLPCLTFSQEESELKSTFSAYLETFYAYDFNKPDGNRLDFVYNHNRHNEFNINIAFLKYKLEYQNVYASVAVHAGTYVDDNYVNEDMKLLSEAYVGIFLNKSKKTSLEVGIMPSYIGFETATSFSNLTLTRSIMAENSPYFFTGAKLNYSPNSKWNFSVLATNGWQRIQKPNNEALPAFGSQVIYKPSAKTSLNWSTFIGDEPIEESLRTRYFSNLYVDHQWNDKWRTIAGFDYGLQKNGETGDFDNWLTPTIITQYKINQKFHAALRAEYYQDLDNVMVATSNPFEVLGLSANLDFLPNSKFKIRTEVRWLDSEEPIFVKNDSLVNSNFMVATSLCFEW